VTLADATPSVEDLERLLGDGGGGSGWGDDDGGDDWGWSEDPSDDERPVRRSRVRRGVAIATVAALALASIGTWIAILAQGSLASAPFGVRSVEVTTVPAGPTRAPATFVSFVVVNESALPGTASCAVGLVSAHRSVGTGRVTTGLLPGGSSLAVRVPVPAARTPIGRGPVAATVHCVTLLSYLR